MMICFCPFSRRSICTDLFPLLNIILFLPLPPPPRSLKGNQLRRMPFMDSTQVSFFRPVRALILFLPRTVDQLPFSFLARGRLRRSFPLLDWRSFCAFSFRNSFRHAIHFFPVLSSDFFWSLRQPLQTPPLRRRWNLFFFYRLLVEEASLRGGPPFFLPLERK